jgi:hypothetical protein
MRATHERDLKIKTSDRLITDNNHAQSGASLHQTSEPVIGLKPHFRAALLYQGHITNKLDDITKSLFAPDENGAAIELRAVPNRNIEPFSLRNASFVIPTPFVFTPTLGE